MKPSKAITAALSTCLLILACAHALIAAPFIDPGSIQVTKILPPPPPPGSPESKMDMSYLKNSRAASTHEQIQLGIAASQDSVFDYSLTLGSWFNARVLPQTAALFTKVTKETDAAIDQAKKTFRHPRPETWKETGNPDLMDGYSYPSGHTTRAYVWAILLANAFPEKAKELHLQARQKAWYRVVLGRHFPSDIRAAKTYGRFLASDFLKSPEFQKPWKEACGEMRRVREASIPPRSFHP